MRPTSLLAAMALVMSPSLLLRGEPPKAGVGDRRPHATTRPATSRPSGDRASLEKSFAESMDGVVFKGSWQATGRGGSGEAAGSVGLGEAKPDRYEIVSAKKVAGDRWVVSARIQFADKDVTLPVPVRVVWAGDTPVITVDEVPLPGLGTYSARVMVYGGFYSGVWCGGEHGGILSGQIVKAEKEAGAATKPAGTDGPAKKAPRVNNKN